VETAKNTFRARLGPVLAHFLGDTWYFLGRDDDSGPSAIDYLVTKPLNNASSLGLLDDGFPTLRHHLQRMQSLPSFAKAYGVDMHHPENDSHTSRLLHLVPASTL
jgi:hypothetical protein